MVLADACNTSHKHITERLYRAGHLRPRPTRVSAPLLERGLVRPHTVQDSTVVQYHIPRSARASAARKRLLLEQRVKSDVAVAPSVMVFAAVRSHPFAACAMSEVTVQYSGLKSSGTDTQVGPDHDSSK